MPNVRPRRLQAQPDLSARFAVHASALPAIRRAMAELPQEVSVDALTAAYDAWLEGPVATTIKDGIATIPVRGLLTKDFSFWNYWYGWSSYAQIAHDLDVVLADPSVRGIVLSIDSPGGQVDGCAELAQRIHAAREAIVSKPLVVHVDGMAASAGYWLASAASRVVLAPTAMAGSIGIVFSFVDWSGAYEQLGIRETEIVSTQSPKKRPDPFEPEGRAQYQVHADAIAEVFLAAVATHRGTTRDLVAEQFGQGDVFVGQSAVAAGLADALGSFEETRRALDAQLTDAERDLITVAIPRREALADRGRMIAAITAAVDAACDSPTQESPMAGTRPTRRSSAVTAAEEDDKTEPLAEGSPGPQVGDRVRVRDGMAHDEMTKNRNGTVREISTAAIGIEFDEMDGVHKWYVAAELESAKEDADAEGEGAVPKRKDEDEDKEEHDMEASALTKTHGAVVARIRARAAAAERARISGIRALGRPGLETVVQGCIDDAGCSIEKAALKLLQHEGEKRGAHLRGIRREEQALDAPDNLAAPEAGGDAAIAGSIVALFHQHNPKRRPATAGRA